jgi:hypothetical protein
MTTPEQTPDIQVETQELTDENLEGLSGSTTGSPSVVFSTKPEVVSWPVTEAGGYGDHG